MTIVLNIFIHHLEDFPYVGNVLGVDVDIVENVNLNILGDVNNVADQDVKIATVLITKNPDFLASFAGEKIRINPI